MTGLREDEREALVEAIYQGRLRNCAETIEGWGKGGHGLLMQVLRAESVRFVADAEPALLDILAARAAQTDAATALDEVMQQALDAEQMVAHRGWNRAAVLSDDLLCIINKVRAALTSEPQPPGDTC